MKAKRVNKTDSETITLEVVKEFKVGRPLFLDARRFLRICKIIESGESTVEACRRQLVHFTSLRKHVQKNEKYQRRLREAEKVREEVLFHYHVANVKKHAPKNVLASLWWLERTRPERFALKTVVRNEGDKEKPSYQLLTREQLVALLEAEKAVLAEAPKGFEIVKQDDTTHTHTGQP